MPRHARKRRYRSRISLTTQRTTQDAKGQPVAATVPHTVVSEWPAQVEQINTAEMIRRGVQVDGVETHTVECRYVDGILPSDLVTVLHDETADDYQLEIVSVAHIEEPRTKLLMTCKRKR